MNSVNTTPLLPAVPDQSESTPVRIPRILVVEDDPTSQELVKGILEQNGFEVILAETIQDAKVAFVKRRPHLVIVDVHLREENGIDFIRAVRRSAARPQTPMIVASSDRLRETVVDAGRATVQGYLLKPFDPATLLEKIRAAMGRVS